MSASAACYHLPGLFEFYDFYRVFLPLFRQHREYFYDWCRIASLYGAPADCIWGGGRVGSGDRDPREVLALTREYGISARLTFSNSLLRPEHLSDPRCNRLCRLLAEGKRGSVTELMVRLEKKRTDRDALSALLDGSRHILAAALLALYGKPPEGPDAELCRQLGRRLGRQKLINTIQMLQTYRGACAYNVGVSHVLGALAVELEELL